jgi:hypothetical protein
MKLASFAAATVAPYTLSRLGQLVDIDATSIDLVVEETFLIQVQQLVSTTNGGVTNSNNEGDFLGCLRDSHEVAGHEDGRGSCGQGRATSERALGLEIGCNCDCHIGGLRVHVELTAEAVAQIARVLSGRTVRFL